MPWKMPLHRSTSSAWGDKEYDESHLSDDEKEQFSDPAIDQEVSNSSGELWATPVNRQDDFEDTCAFCGSDDCSFYHAGQWHCSDCYYDYISDDKSDW